MHKYVSGLQKIFIKNSNKEEAAWVKAYLRNQFECFGIKTPLRRELCKNYVNSSLPSFKEMPEIVEDLWGQLNNPRLTDVSRAGIITQFALKLPFHST